MTNPDGDPASDQQGAESTERVQNDTTLVSLNELRYSITSFHAIVKPVILTMILSALAVVYINTDQSIAEGQASTQAYLAFDQGTSSSSSNNGKNLGLSLANAFIIVAVICALTFVIVILYKYRCMKILLGYMILSSAVLLGFLGYQLFKTAVEAYNLPVDKLTTYAGMYNFAAVGTWSIFFSKGIPLYVTQGYLIATSVILAWQLSNFDAWTAWALLVVLALYDLFAVLTPCGPLRALVELMGREGAPTMPGLLYEANLPSGVARRDRRQRQHDAEENAASGISSETTHPTESSQSHSQLNSVEHDSPAEGDENERFAPFDGNEHGDGRQSAHAASPVEHVLRPTCYTVDDENDSNTATAAAAASITALSNRTQASSIAPNREVEIELPSRRRTEPTMNTATIPDVDRPRGRVPLAIAKMYRLQLVNPEPVALRIRSNGNSSSPAVETTAQGDEGSENVNDVLQRQYTSEQLRSEVEVYFPRNGGMIEQFDPPGRRPSPREQRYVVKDRFGNVRRILYVERNGRIFEERQHHEDDGNVENAEESNSIQLGLGDFIFYSVLVAKAAQYSFATFCACTLVVLAGLGATLVLLAVYGQALPALPISIFLGVFFYLITRAIVEPFIKAMYHTPIYV